MKVLHVIPSLSLKHGGPSFAIPLIARGLARKGVEVDVATTDDDGPGGRITVPLGRRIQQDGFGVFYFEKQTEFYKVSRPFTRWMKEHVKKYDLVHVHALFSYISLSAARIARDQGVPYLIRPVGVLNRWGMEHRRRFLKALSFRIIERPVLRRAAAMHYSTRQEQIEAEQSGATAPPAIVPLEMDTQPFEKLPGPGLFLERYPQAVGRSVVLFLSRIDPKKGIDLLLPAFAEVRKHHPKSLLTIVGDGPAGYLRVLRAQAAGLGLDGDVLWAGFLDGQEKLSALSAATLFVLPSYSENFGIALAEALAAGLPCITTEGVAISREVEKADAGLVIRAEIAPLTAALNRLLGDADLRSRLSANGRDLARSQFSLDAMGAAMKEVYDQVLAGGFLPQLSRSGRIKVLHVIPSLSPKHGGPSFALPLIVRGLVKNGIEVDVATTDDDGPGHRFTVPLGRRVEQDGYGVFYFSKQTEFYKVSLPFTRWIEQHAKDYDLVHVHAVFSYTSTSAARVARRMGVPYIIRPLGVLNRWGMEHRRRFLKAVSLKFIERRVLRNAAAMHYTSRQEQLEAEEAGASAKAVVLPLDIDTRQFERLPGPDAFLRRFPRAEGRPLVLFLSRLDPKKGLELLLPAFVKARQRHPKAMLVIAGNGGDTYVQKLHSLAAKLGLTEDILWTGFITGEDKLSAMSAATLFVLPSFSENFGIALVEALAAGLPCITTEGVAVSEDVREYEAGLVVQSEVSELAGALDQLLGDEELRAKLSQNARRLAKERFSMEAADMALKELYQQIIQNRGKQFAEQISVEAGGGNRPKLAVPRS